MGVISNAVRSAFTIAGDVIERWGDKYRDTTTMEALRRSSARGAELALENATLHERAETLAKQLNDLQDRYRFNGPTLYSDEVDAIECARDFSATGHHRDALQALLTRSDKLGITASQLDVHVNDIIMGKSDDFGWEESDDYIEDAPDEWSSRKFDPELCPSDLDNERPSEECKST